MLPGDMNLNIRSGTVGYSNKILVSDGRFSLVKNSKVNTLGAPDELFCKKAVLQWVFCWEN